MAMVAALSVVAMVMAVMAVLGGKPVVAEQSEGEGGRASGGGG